MLHWFASQDWGVFGEIKNDLDWDEEEESPGYTTLYYSTGDGDDDMSDELNMTEVMQLYDADVITDDTLVFCDGMDDWCPFETAKYLCAWPGEDDDEEGTPPDTLYYEATDGDYKEVSISAAQQLIKEGVISQEDKVWADNMSDWAPLGEAAAALGLEVPTAAPVEVEPEPEKAAPRRPRQKTAVGRPRSKSRVVRTAGGKTIKVGGFKKAIASHSTVIAMTNSEQAEYFLRKFNRHTDINRPKVMILKKEFESFDDRPGGPFGELAEDQAMRLLESRGEAHTLKEIRALVEKIDVDQNHKLSFLEWAWCVFYLLLQQLLGRQACPDQC